MTISIKVFKESDVPGGTYGTSLKGYLKHGIKFQDIVSVLGEPTYGPEFSGDGKVNFEWVVEFEGNIFTIYDWKTWDPEYSMTELERWHVGGKTYSGDFEDLIEELIKEKTHA